MGAPKHTPGPWLAHASGALWEIATQDDRGCVIAEVPCELGTPDIIEADAHLIAAAPELLAELLAAHRIIRNALNVMTTEQKVAWGEQNERDGAAGEGVTRANEREVVIAKAEGRQP
jgi:hypothetical protein